MVKLYTGNEVEGCEICNNSWDNCCCVCEKTNLTSPLSEDIKNWLFGEKK